MSSRNLARRLERLEAELKPSDNPQGVTIFITSPGQPDEIKELRFDLPAKRPRRSWSSRRVFGDAK
jgi:hypothetical protein